MPDNYEKPDNSEIFHAARARININNVNVGYATGATGSRTVNYEPIRVCDELAVVEHVPVSVDVTLSINAYKLSGYSLVKAGIMKPTREVLAATPFEVQFLDSVTGESVATFTGCKGSAENFSFAAGAVNAEDISFVCKDIIFPDAA